MPFRVSDLFWYFIGPVCTDVLTHSMLVRTGGSTRKKKREKRKGRWTNGGGRRKKRKKVEEEEERGGKVQWQRRGNDSVETVTVRKRQSSNGEVAASYARRGFAFACPNIFFSFFNADVGRAPSIFCIILLFYYFN